MIEPNKIRIGQHSYFRWDCYEGPDMQDPLVVISDEGPVMVVWREAPCEMVVVAESHAEADRIMAEMELLFADAAETEL